MIFAPVEDTLSLIPQRPPFVMIDTLMYADDVITRTRFQVKEDNVFIRSGRLQEAALVENIAQTAAAGAGYHSKTANKPVSIGYIGAVNKLQVYFLPEINEELETEVTVINHVFNVTLITGIIRRKGEVLAQCEMKIFITQTK